MDGRSARARADRRTEQLSLSGLAASASRLASLLVLGRATQLRREARVLAVRAAASRRRVGGVDDDSCDVEVVPLIGVATFISESYAAAPTDTGHLRCMRSRCTRHRAHRTEAARVPHRREPCVTRSRSSAVVGSSARRARRHHAASRTTRSARVLDGEVGARCRSRPPRRQSAASREPRRSCVGSLLLGSPHVVRGEARPRRRRHLRARRPRAGSCSNLTLRRRSINASNDLFRCTSTSSPCGRTASRSLRRHVRSPIEGTHVASFRLDTTYEIIEHEAATRSTSPRARSCSGDPYGTVQRFVYALLQSWLRPSSTTRTKPIDGRGAIIGSWGDHEVRGPRQAASDGVTKRPQAPSPTALGRRGVWPRGTRGRR